MPNIDHPATARPDPAAPIDMDATLFAALELSLSSWVVMASAPGEDKASKHGVTACDGAGLLALLGRLQERAEQRCGRPVTVVVMQEAGRDGLWVHRLLQAHGMRSHVVDPSSIAVAWSFTVFADELRYVFCLPFCLIWRAVVQGRNAADDTEAAARLVRPGFSDWIARHDASCRWCWRAYDQRRQAMSFSDIFARGAAMVGGSALLLRRMTGGTPEPAWGSAPAIPAAKPQGNIPTLKMPTAKGWAPGQTPVAAPGLKVNAFATDLKHPRWIEVLPNGDVLIAEATNADRPPRSVFDYAMVSTMRRAAAMGISANRITLLRDANGDGVAETQEVFLEGLNQPFGMALIGDTFYVGNTDGVVAFPYTAGASRITEPGRKLIDFKPGGHWTRSLLPSPDRKKLYAGVGSLTNIADNGMEVESGRAAIYELDVASGQGRIFASGLRNAVGMAWEPQTGVLWTVVNERDGLGDETPPDYLTSVQDGGFYGWPYCYWGQTIDDRVPQDPAAVARAVTPDYALGGHTASLGLCWLPAGTLPGFPDGMAIGQHGSWNRSKLSGYALVFVPFMDGRPAGPPRNILSGFLSPDERESYGRPVGVSIGPDGSVLMADDVGDVIWRVTGT